MAIQSFRDPKTAAFYEGKRIKEFGGFARMAERKLQMLESATVLGDLAALPGNRLEKLKGDREGQHSIRINDQWRVCFMWTEKGPAEVEIVDYH
jgi:toxin HigB-1